jgi:hypothetical protein
MKQKKDNVKVDGMKRIDGCDLACEKNKGRSAQHHLPYLQLDFSNIPSRNEYEYNA